MTHTHMYYILYEHTLTLLFLRLEQFAHTFSLYYSSLYIMTVCSKCRTTVWDILENTAVLQAVLHLKY